MAGTKQPDWNAALAAAEAEICGDDEPATGVEMLVVTLSGYPNGKTYATRVLCFAWQSKVRAITVAKLRAYSDWYRWQPPPILPEFPLTVVSVEPVKPRQAITAIAAE